MGRGAANSVKYGKVELFSADEGTTIDDLMVHLHKILKDHGYPEAGDDSPVNVNEAESTDVDDDDELPLTSEDEEAALDELEAPKKKVLAPWDRVRQNGGEDTDS